MFFTFLKVSAILIIAVALLICIGVGFIRLIDYFEEHPYGSKELVKKVVYTSMALHTIFLLTGMPILQIVFSLAIQYLYASAFNNDEHTLLQLTDPKFLGGLFGSLVNYFLMLRFFTVYEKKLILFVPYLAIIWATPICFFFSVNATEDTIFVKKGGRRNKTYAGLFVDWVFSLGGKMKELKK